MAFMIYISDTVLEEVDLESSLLQVFAGVADAVFGGDSAYIYIGGVKKLENFSKSLSSLIHAVESGILLFRSATAFVPAVGYFTSPVKKVSGS